MRCRLLAALAAVSLAAPVWGAPVGQFVKGRGTAPVKTTPPAKAETPAPSQPGAGPPVPSKGGGGPTTPAGSAPQPVGGKQAPAVPTAGPAPGPAKDGSAVQAPAGTAVPTPTGKAVPSPDRLPPPSGAEAAGKGADAASASPSPTPPPTGVGLTTTPTAGWAEVSGWVFSADGGGRGLAPVAYWPATTGWSGERDAVVVRAGRSARYEVRLPDGRWMGTACGAAGGFQPLFWELVVADGEVVSYRERDDRMPVVAVAAVAATGAGGAAVTGDRVVLEGSGFGCSGGVVVTQAGREVARVTSFSARTDGRVAFDLPEGRWLRGIPLGFSYVHGRWRSAPAVTDVQPYLAPAARTGSPAGRFPGGAPFERTK